MDIIDHTNSILISKDINNKLLKIIYDYNNINYHNNINYDYKKTINMPIYDKSIIYHIKHIYDKIKPYNLSIFIFIMLIIFFVFKYFTSNNSDNNKNKFHKKQKNKDDFYLKL